MSWNRLRDDLVFVVLFFAAYLVAHAVHYVATNSSPSWLAATAVVVLLLAAGFFLGHASRRDH